MSIRGLRLDNMCAREYNPDSTTETVKYCQDAKKLLGIEVECGKECPLLKSCPRIILEDAIDKAVSKAINVMMRCLIEKAKGGSGSLGR